MEQEELTVDPQYLKGFNNGYLLAKHDPDLTAKLTAQPNVQNEYFKGLVDGKQEYEREGRELTRDFSKESPAKDEPDLDHER